MKTAIPCANGTIAPDFETSNEFTLVTGSGYDLSVETITMAVDNGAKGLTDRLKDLGVERILAAGISTDAIKHCEVSGFQVFHGASGTLSDGLNLIRLGILDNMARGSCGGGCGSGGCGSGGCGSETGSEAASGCGSGSCGCK